MKLRQLADCLELLKINYKTINESRDYLICEKILQCNILPSDVFVVLECVFVYVRLLTKDSSKFLHWMDQYELKRNHISRC